MDKEEKSKDNKKDSKEEIRIPDSQPSAINPTKKKPSSNTPEKSTERKKKKGISNTGLLLVNIGMLLAFIVVNYVLITNSEKNTRAEMRAYVQVKGAKFIDFRVNHPFNIKLEIINTGKTPAYGINILCKMKFAGPEVYESDWVDSTGKQIFENNYLLGASSTFDNDMQFDRVMTEEDSIRFVKNEGLLTVVGDITYEDIFRDDHLTRFYLRFNPRTQEFVYYKHFNDADRKPYD